MAATRESRHHAKRHGKHQKQTRHFLKVYAPYLPLTLIIGLGLLFSAYWQPRVKHGVLAYATNTTVSGLLQTTNQQRTANGVGGLTLNSQLDQAAQAKANDMVTRDYWSHNTPDGNPPWVFITQAGYSYSAAAENLAYGFATSDDTVAGWMNSPPHRENLLNGTYTEVGFGIANSQNYVGTGQETVVVAMYAKPQVAAAATQAPASPVPTTTASVPPATAPAPAATPKASPAPLASQAAPTPPEAEPVAVIASAKPDSDTEYHAVLSASAQRVSRLQAVTNGALPWLASITTALSVIGVAILIIKHSLALQKVLVRGERYVVQHVLLDATVVSFIGLCMIVSQTAGVIR